MLLQHRLRILPALLLGTFPLLLQPISSGQGTAPVTLRMQFRAGDVRRYQTTMRMKALVPMSGQPAPFVTTVDTDVTQQMRVQRLLSDGAEVAVTVLKGRLIMNGKEFPTPNTDKPVVLTYDQRGTIRSMSAFPSDGNPLAVTSLFGSGALSMQGVYLPPKPVRPGDTWTQAANIAGLSQGGGGTVRARFIKQETVGRYRTARIRAMLTMPLHVLLDARQQPTTVPAEAVSTLTGNLKMIFDSDIAINEGKLVRSSGAGSATILLGTNSPSAKSSAVKRGSGARPGVQKAPRTTPNGMNITLMMEVGNNLID